MGAPAMFAAAAVMSAVGAIQQGKAAKSQANNMAAANEYNAQLKDRQAAIERAQWSVREEQQRRQAGAILGKQRAAVAQSGVGFGGSSLDVIDQSSFLAELDALTIRYEGENRAKGLLSAAEMDRYEASANRAAGKNAMKGAYLSAGAALLSGAGAYKYYGAGGGAASTSYSLTPGTAPTTGGLGLRWGG